MSSQPRCIIVGGSHAASQLAPTLRQQGWNGSILIISDEYFLPYHRPPLSKDYLSGKKSIEDILIRPPALYQKADIQFMLGTRVTRINRDSQNLELNNGQSLGYDKLVLTTGARVRKIAIEGADLDGVLYLRDAADVNEIKKRCGAGKKAVIVGGGYIGLETAASLRKQETEVTVLEAMPRILQRVTAPEVSAFYQRVHTEEGVNIITDASIEKFSGEKKVDGVVLSSGETLAADFVIVGIGVIPNTELAEEAGLTVENGICVDEFGQTNDPNIYAAGDCTNHVNGVYQRKMRLESVQNANEQATAVAKALAGKPAPYSALPWFWSDQYDLKLQIAGLSQGFDQVVIRGDIENTRAFAAYYLCEGKVIAVDCVNKPQEFMMGKRLITEDKVVDPARLADETIPAKEL